MLNIKCIFSGQTGEGIVFSIAVVLTGCIRAADTKKDQDSADNVRPKIDRVRHRKNRSRVTFTSFSGTPWARQAYSVTESRRLLPALVVANGLDELQFCHLSRKVFDECVVYLPLRSRLAILQEAHRKAQHAQDADGRCE